LVESLSGPFEPAAYQDDYRLRLLDLIEHKAKGQKVVVAPAEEQPAEVVRPDGRPRGEAWPPPRSRAGADGTRRSVPHPRLARPDREEGLSPSQLPRGCVAVGSMAR